ncbi:VOC family protein [Myxococcota bacterium]
MSHRSRLYSVLVDVGAESYESAARFWGGALGRDPNFHPDGRYCGLKGEIPVLVQNVEPGREGMHVDIETDDVEAEVARLEKLGARRRNKAKDWWVMVAPGGHPFCVIPAGSPSWPKGATEWP